MNTFKNKITGFLITVFLLGSFSCTNLDENLYEQYLVDDFFKTEEEILAGLAPAYGGMRGLFDVTFEIQEYMSGNMISPTRGQHWYEGGRFWRAHTFQLDPVDALCTGPWNYCFGGVSTCNRLLYILKDKEFPNKEQFMAELKMIRAYYYFYALDMFGNIPWIDRYDLEPGFLPQQETQPQIYQNILKDITENIEFLSEDVNTATYGRFTKWAAYSLLARLYLNAHVFKSESPEPNTWKDPEWDKCIEACNKVIASGKYQLENDYFSNFRASNEGSRENIFVIPYDDVYAKGFYLPNKGLHYSHPEKFGTKTQPWNGMCMVPEFFESFDWGGTDGKGILEDTNGDGIWDKFEPGENPDLRWSKGFLYGPQIGKDGSMLLCTEESKGKGLFLYPFAAKNASGDLDSEREVQFIHTWKDAAGVEHRDELQGFNYKFANEYNGARLNKYEFEDGGRADMNNDLPIFRYADILMMKAECLFRKGDKAGAVELINQIRARAFETPKPITVDMLTEDRMWHEIRWEFFGEMKARQDARRFDKMSTRAWFGKPAYSSHKNDWMPIPLEQLSANQNLKQNPHDLM
ncbi:hypothetical protein M2459_003285 [Parabacteroides sp. PF5-5]|uniref:RagB/SusD family nutrient uptake outer membrane protein n=1 Tax=unclassified Parabacteroides TaxID=2649774 RepID=UPI002473ADD6|nr:MULTISPECIES: RagB/SusD family nutrient uptake outer membrane protein [unclassified Parabacteroides]MDH6306560.1 hypothetical protein [Parabacteroides sp. PH5-39]MDH6317527.1 hypothetical protein [Parabacteroides sp. PF5-13]MDH6321271.1 hypothetical protein [Parabacteroides sp. PH5-13]MDH6325003.1 hypothetical protein [Parabacteroides sp. PH5-8]MDH6328712.1 hypothetical protein [Parabacteroides sp. PH5-41]